MASSDEDSSDSGDQQDMKAEVKAEIEEAVQASAESAEEEVDAAYNSDDDLRAFKDPDPASREWKNRQRTLVVCSRGIAGRMRHLVKDLTDMIPNTKLESKLNRKDAGDVIDELCYEKSCNNCMFFEQRK